MPSMSSPRTARFKQWDMEIISSASETVISAGRCTWSALARVSHSQRPVVEASTSIAPSADYLIWRLPTNGPRKAVATATKTGSGSANTPTQDRRRAAMRWRR